MKQTDTPAEGPAGQPDAGGPAPSPFAFRHPNYVFFWATRMAAGFANQIVIVSVGWQLYDLTGSVFLLGLVGLAQFAPSLLLVLVTGQVADRYSRRNIMALVFILQTLVAGALLTFTLSGSHSVWLIYAFLVLFGIGRAFYMPASSSIVTSLLPPEALSNGITWLSSSWQAAAIIGPVAGGLLYGLHPYAAYGTSLTLFALAFLLILFVRESYTPKKREVNAEALLAGFRYLWSEKIVLGAISLDLFAVLLGGATALMPAVARDVLHAGPMGLGMLRAAPGIGAIGMAIALSFFPIRDHAGRIMFGFVALFGLGTVVFGLSETVWLSVAALIVMGASDLISVTVRETLIQLWTPDSVRGRVNAVNGVFIGASNEIGEFRAGLMGAWITVMPAIVVGGIGTVAVAGLWAVLFPQLYQARSLAVRKVE